jgi:hypothetical protein
MFTFRQTLTAALVALSGTLINSSAHAIGAAYTFTLDNNGALTITRPLTGTATGSLFGTVTNFSNSTLNFTGYSVGGTFDAANDVLSHTLPTPLFQTLAPFGIFHGDLADFTVTPATPLGLYDLNNGSTSFNTVNLGANGFFLSRNYSVNVVPSTAPAVPEPSSLTALSLGAVGLAVLVLRRRKTSGV